MRKFKLFSYLLIAGMLFSNANLYAMEGQNQNLGNEENQAHEASYTIFLPFYDGAAKTIFLPQTDQQKRLLASFINELFPEAIPDSSCIQQLAQEYNFNKTNSPEGKCILDIPFKVEYYKNDSLKVDFYDFEIQQYDEKGIESRFRKYSVALRSANKCDSIRMISLLNLKNYGSYYQREANCCLATGECESIIDEGNEMLYLNANYYSSPASKIAGVQGSYFNGTKLPSNGWMAFFDYCAKNDNTVEQHVHNVVCTVVKNILLENYNEHVQEAIELLDISNEKSKSVAAAINNEKTIMAGIIAAAEERSRQEGLKEGIESELQRSKEMDSKYPGLFKENVAALKRQHQADPEMVQLIDDIAKRLELSHKAQQGAESESLPTSTK